MNRRSLLKSAMFVIAPSLTVWKNRTVAQERTTAPVWRHGMSAFGDLKYSPGFEQFDYVNANAPKGGSACQIAIRVLRQFEFRGSRSQRQSRPGHRSRLRHAFRAVA